MVSFLVTVLQSDSRRIFLIEKMNIPLGGKELLLLGGVQDVSQNGKTMQGSW
jgi:hypothetical protein